MLLIHWLLLSPLLMLPLVEVCVCVHIYNDRVCVYFSLLYLLIRIEYVCEIRLQFQIDFPIGLKIEINEKKTHHKKSVYTFEIFTRSIKSLISQTHIWNWYFLTATTIFSFVFVCIRFASPLNPFRNDNAHRLHTESSSVYQFSYRINILIK